MKRRLLIVMWVSLLSLFGMPALAHAQTTKFLTREKAAFAQFQSTDSTGCILTQAFVGDVLESQRTPPGGPQFNPSLAVEVDTFNLCIGIPLISAQGFTSTFTTSIAKNLNSASLSATLPLFDFPTGNTIHVTINLNWTGTGDLQHDISTTHYSANGTTVITHSNAAFRSGQASGTVSDGTTNYTTLPSVSAVLQKIKDGTITITH